LSEALRDTTRRAAAAPYAESLRACRTILQSWSFDRDTVRPALGPTIPMHCSDDFLTGCRDLAREFEVGIQTHLAESATQAVIAQQRYGTSLTAHLAGLGLLGERFSGAHAIWIDRDDMRRIADAGGAVAHNPLSNLRLGSGLAAVRAMLDCGLTVGIGTDATNTSDTQNMFEATRLASYLSRVRGPTYREWLSAEEAFTLATAGSAHVLGFGGEMGSIVPHALADLVFLDLSHINYVPLRDALLQMVNGESGTAIDAVMVGGRFVLRGGKLLTVDEAKMRRDAESARERLDKNNDGALRIARALEDWVGEFCIAQARHPGLPQRHLAAD
jgi:guanine deaminase